MCSELCREDEHGYQFGSCGTCSRAICFDVSGDGDDIIARACVVDGDPACVWCARAAQFIEDRDADAEYGPSPGPWDDDDRWHDD